MRTLERTAVFLPLAAVDLKYCNIFVERLTAEEPNKFAFEKNMPGFKFYVSKKPSTYKITSERMDVRTL
jgi:hypothetical protein